MSLFCLHSGCKTKDGKHCKFPFTYQTITYNNCPVDPIDLNETWCSIETDSDGVHINGIGNYGFCSDDCKRCKDYNVKQHVDNELVCKSMSFFRYSYAK